MTGRSALIILAILAASGASAEEVAPEPKPPERLQGFLSHGDSGDVMEDFFGSRVERKPSEDASTGSRKYDPAIRWDDRPARR